MNSTRYVSEGPSLSFVGSESIAISYGVFGNLPHVTRPISVGVAEQLVADHKFRWTHHPQRSSRADSAAIRLWLVLVHRSHSFVAIRHSSDEPNRADVTKSQITLIVRQTIVGGIGVWKLTRYKEFS